MPLVAPLTQEVDFFRPKIHYQHDVRTVQRSGDPALHRVKKHQNKPPTLEEDPLRFFGHVQVVP